MAHSRRFRFGVQLSTPRPGEVWAELARQYEGAGFATLFLPDHFGDQMAPVAAMMAAAAATTELKIGALVFDNDFRHPVVLAKEMATIDVLSAGRVEFGLGAGWMTTDYDQSGIRKERDGVRIARMAEALDIIVGLWSDGAFSYKGEHYTITGLDGLPKPMQKPHPPIIIGGGGPKVLGVAARHADIIGVNPAIPGGKVDLEAARDGFADRIDQKLDWIRDAAGERFEDIELNMLVFVAMITDDRATAAEQIGGLFGAAPSEALELPNAWFGSEEQIVEKLYAMRERWGISYFVLQRDAADAMAGVVAKLSGA